MEKRAGSENLLGMIFSINIMKRSKIKPIARKGKK
jgi:hypothetical protein